MLKQIISGGQTGIDFVSLKAARSVGIPTGGWAPKNYITCDGRNIELKNIYHLKEIDIDVNLSVQYAILTQRNVNDSDGTVIFSFKDSNDSVGTQRTI